MLLLDLLAISVERFVGGVRTESNDHLLLVILLGSVTMTLVDIVRPNIATGSYSAGLLRSAGNRKFRAAAVEGFLVTSNVRTTG